MNNGTKKIAETTGTASARRTRGWLVPILVILLIITGGFSVYALVSGMNTHIQSTREPERAQKLTVPLRTQTLIRSYSSEVQITPAHTQDIALTIPGVVTRPGAAAGTILHNGDIVSTINERPLFIFSSDTPAYRDLVPGSVGRDVHALQVALENMGYSIWDTEGHYGEATANAIYSLYIDRGYAPPADTDAENRYSTPLPRAEYTLMEGNDYSVMNSCGVKGAQVSGSLCTLHDGNYTLTLSADNSDTARELAPGQQVRITGAGETIQGTLGEQTSSAQAAPSTNSAPGQAAPAAQQAPAAARPSFRINAALPQGINPQAKLRANVIIQQSPDNALTVMESAIVDRNGARELVLENNERVAISTGVCAQGECEITNPPASLRAGLNVKLREDRNEIGKESRA